MRSLIILMIGLLGSSTLFFPLYALGADTGGVPDTGAIQEIEDMFRHASSQWPPIIMTYTTWLFWSLVTISWTWTFGQMSLKGTDATELLAELTRRTILTGVFWWLFQSAPYLGESLVNSFSYIGNKLVGQPISANSIFDIGVSLSLSILEGISLWKGPANLGYVLVAIVIIIILALIALQMLLVVVQYYVFLNAGVVMMGFLGHEWSREYAINYFRLLLSLAVKFFFMQIIVALTMVLIDTWIKSSDLTWVQVVVLLPILVVVYGLVKEIPAMAASMISGTDSTGGAVASTMAGAAMIGGLAMSGGGFLAAMTGGASNASSLAYNAWKQAKGLLSGEGGGEDTGSGYESGEGGESRESYDPATARVPDDNHATSSGDVSHDEGGGASPLPRSHQGDNVSSNTLEGAESHAASPSRFSETLNTHPSQSAPSTEENSTPENTIHAPVGPAKSTGMTPSLGKTARLAGKIATKAIVNEGKSAFVNGFKAFAAPNKASVLGRAAQSIASQNKESDT